MSDFDKTSASLGILPAPDQVKEAADAMARLHGWESDGWFTATITYRLVEGAVTAVDEAKVSRAQRE